MSSSKLLLIAIVLVSLFLLSRASVQNGSPSSSTDEDVRTSSPPPPPSYPPPHHPSPSAAPPPSLLPHDVSLRSVASLISLDWVATRSAIKCAQRLGQGRYWQQEQRRCSILPGWTAPLRDFEASIDELSCESDFRFDFTAATNSSNSSNKWFRFAFQNDSLKPDQVIGGLFFRQVVTTEAAASANTPLLLTDDSDAPLSLPSEWRREYSIFVFFTSFLFPSYLPWRPNPRRANLTILPGNVIQNTFRAMHDGDSRSSSSSNRSNNNSLREIDKMYRMENCCISPFDGLSGFFPSGASEYRGSLDDRKFYHKMVGLPLLLRERFVRRKTPPPFLDQRLAVLFPLIQHSRFNLAHTQHQVLSLIGFLQRLKAEHNNGLAPLIVFVYEHHWSEDLELNHSAAMGLFFRVLDLPYASIMAPLAGIGGSPTTERERLVKVYKRLSRHSTNGNDVFNRHASPSGGGEICFSRSVVWMNCFSPRCELNGPESEIESFSFGQWVRPTSARREMISALVDGLDRCLPPKKKQSQLESSSSSSSSSPPLPRLFFDVRTGSMRTPFSKVRSIRNLGGLISEVLEGIRGYVSDDIVFAEPWRGSRAKYLTDVRQSDIFIGVHGAAFSQTVFMPSNSSVVVELTLPHFHPHRMRPDAWFGVYTRARQHDHFFFEIMNTSVFGASRRRMLGSVNEWEELGVIDGTNSSNSSNEKQLLLKSPDLRWSIRGIGLKDEFSIAPQMLIDLIRVSACRWLTKKSSSSSSNEMKQFVQSRCHSSRDIAAACRRLTGAADMKDSSSSSSTRTDCIKYRTLHYVVDDGIYAPYMVQAVFRSFFGLDAEKVSLAEAEAIAVKIRTGLKRALRTLAEARMGGGFSASSSTTTTTTTFMEFEAGRHLQLRSSGAGRMTLLWSMLVNHLGEWDQSVDVAQQVVAGGGDRKQQEQQPDCCLVLQGVRRTCLYISAVNVNEV